MNDELAKTFGESFAESHQKQIQKKRQQRNRITEEVMKNIARKAVNGSEMTPENPVFQYTTDEGITHDVALVTFPDPDSRPIWSFMTDGADADNGLNEDSASIPFDFMGDWISCLFNDKTMLKKAEPGEMYLIAGEMSQWETDKGEVNDQFSPVRGLISLQEARELADEELEEEGFTEEESEPEPEGEDPFAEESEPEPEEEETEEEVEEDDDSGGLFGDTEEEDETEEEESNSLPVSEIQGKVDDLGEQDDEVWELQEDDDAKLTKLAKVICKHLELDNEDQVKAVAYDYIESQREDDEEEEEESSLFG